MPSNWNSSRVRHSCNCRWTLPVARCCCWPFLLALVKPRKCTRVNCHWPDFWPPYQKEANHGCHCCRILLPTILNTISWFITFVAGRFSSRPPAKCRAYTDASPEWMHFRLRRVQKVGHICRHTRIYVCVCSVYVFMGIATPTLTIMAVSVGCYTDYGSFDSHNSRRSQHAKPMPPFTVQKIALFKPLLSVVRLCATASPPTVARWASRWALKIN